MAAKYEVSYKEDREILAQDFTVKGLAFAFAKRKAQNTDGKRVEVRLFVSIPESQANPKKDKRDGRRWWRATKRYDFYRDGNIDSQVLVGAAA